MCPTCHAEPAFLMEPMWLSVRWTHQRTHSLRPVLKGHQRAVERLEPCNERSFPYRFCKERTFHYMRSRTVGGSRSAAMNVPFSSGGGLRAPLGSPSRVERTFAVHPPVRVRAEEVPLTLDESSGEPRSAQAVVVRQRRREAGGRDTQRHRRRDHRTPGVLRVLHRLAETAGGQQRRQARLVGV